VVQVRRNRWRNLLEYKEELLLLLPDGLGALSAE